MATSALDRRLSFTTFIKGLAQKVQGILSKALTPEEKLALILEEMKQDVKAKRLTARGIRTKMTALSDPDTAELEPIERLKARRQKLIAQGGMFLKQPETPARQTQLGQLTQEVKALTTSLTSLEQTYTMLSEAYAVALETYKVALAAYEHAQANGPSLLFAIRAHQDALKVREGARTGTAPDASFLRDLTTELEKAQRELRSDAQLDRELDATTPEVHPLMAEGDQQEQDAAILAEFQGAAG